MAIYHLTILISYMIIMFNLVILYKENIYAEVFYRNTNSIIYRMGVDLLCKNLTSSGMLIFLCFQ